MEGPVALDSNILIHFLDPRSEIHNKVVDRVLSLDSWAACPTVVHECYHSLVFKLGMPPSDAGTKTRSFINDRRTIFMGQYKKTSLLALRIADETGLGGRDALIASTYMLGKLQMMYTFDTDFLQLGKISHKKSSLSFKNPI